MVPVPIQGFNGHGPGGSGGGQAGAPSMSAADVWRVLRGNLWLIFAFVFASAIAGYSANDYLARYHSRYTAYGYVSIQEPTVYDPQTRTQVGVGGGFPGLPIYQRTQATLIKNEGLFSRVLQNPSSPIRSTGWFHSFEVPVKDTSGTITTVFDSVAAKQSLDESFVAEPVDQTNLIKIGMTYSSNRDARDIVEAIVEQHLTMQSNLLQQRQVEKSQVLEDARGRQTAKVRDLEARVHQLAADLNIDSGGAPNTGRYDSLEAELSEHISERLKISSALFAVKSRLDKFMAAKSNGEEPEGVEQAVNQDPDVRRYKEQIADMEIDIKSLYQADANSPTIKGLQAKLNATRDKLQEASDAARVSARDEQESGLQSDLQNLQQQLDSVNQQINTISEKQTEMSTGQSQYQSLSDDLNRARADLGRTDQDIESLSTQIQQLATGLQWEQRPITPDSPSFPKLYISMIISVMLGLVLSIGIAFLREMMDTTVRSPRDISRVGSLTLLGMIPHEDDDPQSAGVPLPMVIYQAPTSIMAEGFRQVRTRLQHAASLDTTRSIMVTSSSPGDGKSLVASNLAAGLALNGRRILLVDSNFRKPSLDKSFAVDNNIGFSDVLASLDRFDAAVHKTQVPNLDLMPTGPRPSNPTELLESQMLLDFIERSLEEYDHIIFDTGPMLLISETAALAPRVDGVITVVRARTNSRGLLQRMRDNLRQLKAEHLGVVLNAVRSQGGGYYGRNIKTYYEYQTQVAGAN